MAGPCQQSGRAMPALEVADKGLVEGVLPTLPSTRVNRRAVERLVPAWEAPEKKNWLSSCLGAAPRQAKGTSGDKGLKCQVDRG